MHIDSMSIVNFMNQLKYYVFPLRLTDMATESRYSTGYRSVNLNWGPIMKTINESSYDYFP